MSLAASIARNKRKTAILTLYALATVLLLAWRFQHYAHAPSVLVPIARASAAGIYFNFALVLLPLLRFLFSRRSLSFLRAAAVLLQRDVDFEHQVPLLHFILHLVRYNTDRHIGIAILVSQFSAFLGGCDSVSFC